MFVHKQTHQLTPGPLEQEPLAISSKFRGRLRFTTPKAKDLTENKNSEFLAVSFANTMYCPGGKRIKEILISFEIVHHLDSEAKSRSNNLPTPPPRSKKKSRGGGDWKNDINFYKENKSKFDIKTPSCLGKFILKVPSVNLKCKHQAKVVSGWNLHADKRRLLYLQ